MTAVSDSLVFRHLFSTPESSEIWADQKRTQYYLDFEGALAVVQARLGIIPKEAGDLIKSKCRVEFMNMEELGEETKKIGYPVLPVVKQLVRSVNEVKEGVGEWAHWGATTQVRKHTFYLRYNLITQPLLSSGCNGHGYNPPATRYLQSRI